MTDAREVVTEAMRLAIGPGEVGAEFAETLAAIAIDALSEAGLTVCGEQVGTQDRDGFLHELRQQVEGRPVFIGVRGAEVDD